MADIKPYAVLVFEIFGYPRPERLAEYESLAARYKLEHPHAKLSKDKNRSYRNFRLWCGREALKSLKLPEDLLRSIYDAVEGLQPRQKEVIIYRFGLNGGEPLEFSEIASRMPNMEPERYANSKITNARARQLGNIAIRRLKGSLRAKTAAILNDNALRELFGFEPIQEP